MQQAFAFACFVAILADFHFFLWCIDRAISLPSFFEGNLRELIDEYSMKLLELMDAITITGIIILTMLGTISFLAFFAFL